METDIVTDEGPPQWGWEENEAVIGSGLVGFLAVGERLLDQRKHTERLEAEYGTWEHYCRTRWNLSLDRSYDLMSAAKVVQSISEISETPPPTVESHAAELSRVKDPEVRAKVWKTVVETHGPKKVTAPKIREAVNVVAAAATMGDEAAQAEMARKQYRAKLAKAIAAVTKIPGSYNPEEVATYHSAEEVERMVSTASNLLAWTDRVSDALPRGLRLVGDREAS